MKSEIKTVEQNVDKMMKTWKSLRFGQQGNWYVVVNVGSRAVMNELSRDTVDT